MIARVHGNRRGRAFEIRPAVPVGQRFRPRRIDLECRGNDILHVLAGLPSGTAGATDEGARAPKNEERDYQRSTEARTPREHDAPPKRVRTFKRSLLGAAPTDMLRATWSDRGVRKTCRDNEKRRSARIAVPCKHDGYRSKGVLGNDSRPARERPNRRLAGARRRLVLRRGLPLPAFLDDPLVVLFRDVNELLVQVRHFVDGPRPA